MKRGSNPCPGEGDEEADDDHATDEAQLLPDDGEDEVVPVVRDDDPVVAQAGAE